MEESGERPAPMAHNSELTQLRQFILLSRESVDQHKKEAKELRAKADEHVAAAEQAESEYIKTLNTLLSGKQVIVTGVVTAAEYVDLSDSAIPYWEKALGLMRDTKCKVVGVRRGNSLKKWTIGANQEGVYITLEDLEQDFGGRGRRTQMDINSVAELTFTEPISEEITTFMGSIALSSIEKTSPVEP